MFQAQIEDGYFKIQNNMLSTEAAGIKKLKKKCNYSSWKICDVGGPLENSPTASGKGRLRHLPLYLQCLDWFQRAEVSCRSSKLHGNVQIIDYGHDSIWKLV